MCSLPRAALLTLGVCLFLAICPIVWGQSQYAESYKAGLELEKAGKAEEARRQFESALQQAATTAEKVDAQLAIGRALDLQGQFPQARAEYAKALAIEGITPAQVGQARFNIGASYVNGEHQYQPGFKELEAAIALEGAATKTKVDANMLIARVMAGYNHVWAWPRCVTAYESILALPEITAEQRLAARKGLIEALMGLKKYADARRVMNDIMAASGLAAKERVATQILIGKMSLLSRNFADVREEMARALALEGVSDTDKADIQLQIALSYYDAQDYERAKPELLKVLAMPGANAQVRRPTRNCSYSPAREADLMLHLRKLVPDDGRTLCVLLVGSSMISRGDLPALLAEMSASAPADRPRILCGLFARNATGMAVFWEDGNDSPETVRSLIAAQPWDAVVLETFHTMKHDDFVKYGNLYGDLVKAHKAKLVFYASPVAKAEPYPDAHRKFQNEISDLGLAVGASVAPAVDAYMRVLGPAPTPEQFGVLYDDWIHPSTRGNYVIACCLYAALTGYSPVGLAHPGIPDAEAAKLQDAAWQAVQNVRNQKGAGK